jgi:Ulp1 family protease
MILILFLIKLKSILKYPLKEALDQTVITNDDLLCLRDGEFLNDTIIMFYLKYFFKIIMIYLAFLLIFFF